MSEKLHSKDLRLPTAQSHFRAPQTFFQRHRREFYCLSAAAAVFILLLNLNLFKHVPISSHRHGKHPVIAEQCQQVAPLVPGNGSEKLTAMEDFLGSSEFRNQSIVRLSNSVKIRTESFDDMGPIGEDKRWDIFYDFHAYLEGAFPLIHSKLEKEVVNVHGLVYTWPGSRPGLKATLLMAHQDVVPVPESTIDAWTFPPFDGVYDGKYIWGRGASDCKSTLIAIMESVELLLAADFQPQRTIILSFGFDEEIAGSEGAGHLAPYLIEKHGKDSIAAIIDEGAGIYSAWGSTIAAPGVGEKGYIDIEIVVRMPGGHSSIPPTHNGIGVMSELITLIEAHPYEPRLYEQNPYLGFLQCGAAHSPEFPKKLKKLLPSHSNAGHCPAKKDKLALEASKDSLAVKYLMTTSVAVDIINGGVKVNALPERTSATVNQRINVGEHASDVKKKIRNLAKHVAEKYNLTLHAFDANARESPNSITLTSTAAELEPAPVTPTTVEPLSAYAVLAGTTRGLYGEEIIVAPGIMTGNTDTRYYWDLSTNIFRYAPGWDKEQEGLGNIHTVDERVSVKAHVSAVRFYSAWVRNMDAAALD
jgi:Gly-Xaa carboxypeptidase